MPKATLSEEDGYQKNEEVLRTTKMVEMFLPRRT